MTTEEEDSLVRFIKNKNRCMQALNKKDIEKLILNILCIRDFTNKKMNGGRKFKMLSDNAKSALPQNRFVISLHQMFESA